MNDSTVRCCPDVPESKGDTESCCGLSAGGLQPEFKDCPVCGRQGQSVPLTAVENLLKEEFRTQQKKDGEYRLCTNPECPAVYYNPEQGQVFDKNALRVRVWLKDPGDDVPLCYCRKITRGQVKAARQNGARTYSDVVKAAGVEHERCNCQYENPAGKCCRI